MSYICSNGLTQFLDIMLQLPEIDVNKADNDGNSPLHFAAEAGTILIAGWQSPPNVIVITTDHFQDVRMSFTC